MNRKLAIILRELMTTVPIFVGFLLTVGSAGALELNNISIAQSAAQGIIGLCLLSAGVICLNYFEN